MFIRFFYFWSFHLKLDILIAVYVLTGIAENFKYVKNYIEIRIWHLKLYVI